MHGRRYTNEGFYFKAEDRSLGSGAFAQDKQTLSQAPKPSADDQASLPAQYMGYKQGVFQKLVMPSQRERDLDENAQADFDEAPGPLSDSKIIKSDPEQSQHGSNPIQDFSKSRSESC